MNNKIRKLRESRGLSQGEAAKRMGIARTTYSNYEAGNREPDFDTIKRIANFYDVSVDFLLGGSDKSYNDEDTTIRLIEEEANRLGLTINDPIFQKLLHDAFDMLRIARGQNNE